MVYVTKFKRDLNENSDIDAFKTYVHKAENGVTFYGKKRLKSLRTKNSSSRKGNKAMERAKIGNLDYQDVLDQLGFESASVDIVAEDAMLSIPLEECTGFFDQDSTFASVVKSYKISFNGVTKSGQEAGVIQLTCLYKQNDRNNISEDEARATYNMAPQDLASILLSATNPVIIPEMGMATDNDDWIRRNGELLSNLVVYLADCFKKYLRVTGQGEVGSLFITHTRFEHYGDILAKAGYSVVHIRYENTQNDHTFDLWVDHIEPGEGQFGTVDTHLAGGEIPKGSEEVVSNAVDTEEVTGTADIISMPTRDVEETEK